MVSLKCEKDTITTVSNTFKNAPLTHLQDQYLNVVQTHKWGKAINIYGEMPHINGDKTRSISVFPPYIYVAFSN